MNQSISAPVASPVLSGQVCPYCNNPTEFTDSAEVYEKSYGMIYICRPCQAWVGVHQGTDQALGRLANAELRELKMIAHRWFDPIAKEGLINEIYSVYMTGTTTRAKAYDWLAAQMGIKPEYCHIGMFDADECREVIRICQPVVERYDGSGDIY